MHLEDLTRLRQLAYRLFASTLLYPEEGRSTTLAVAAAELLEHRHSMVEFAFFPQWQRLLACLADLPDHRALEEEYVRVFMHNPERLPCLPYESAYVDPGGQAAGWVLAVLDREYSASGLTLSSSQRNPPDHAAVELEFMAFLCERELDAWDRKAVDHGVQVLGREAAFLDGHLTRWVPEWAQLVADAGWGKLYPVVAEAVRAFISHDRDLIAILLSRFRGRPGAAQSGAVDRLAGEEQQRHGSFRHAP